MHIAVSLRCRLQRSALQSKPSLSAPVLYSKPVFLNSYRSCFSSL